MSDLLIYPGSQSKLRAEIALALAEVSGHQHLPYREPFAGSAAVAIHVAGRKQSSKIWLNDLDLGVACFWKTIIEYPALLQERVFTFRPTKAAYYHAKTMLLNQRVMPTSVERIVEIAFQQLVVQKTSPSALGVRSGSPRGGNGQNSPPYVDDGRWRLNAIGCRWSPPRLHREIAKAHNLFSRLKIHCTCFDFSVLIEDESERSALYLDPSYWQQGKHLYHHWLCQSDHIRLAALLKMTPHPFVLSYADDPAIRSLYKWANIREVIVRSSLNHQVRKELLITKL